MVDGWNINVLLMQPYHPCFQASGIVHRTHLLTAGVARGCHSGFESHRSELIFNLFDCVVHVTLLVAIFQWHFLKTMPVLLLYELMV